MLRGDSLSTLARVSATAIDLLEFERVLINAGETVVGVDEVGRGALAGPMTVGAVVVRSVKAPPLGLNDSKLLTPARRSSLVVPLRQWAAAWSLGSVSAVEIDVWGLRLALAVAATRAIEGLSIVPTHALIDGSFNLLQSPRNGALELDAPPLRFASLPATTIIKGDRRCATIAAAAVLAKVHRDAVMVALSNECEDYGWANNKGYGAPEHLEVLRRLGPSDHHRRTWRLPAKSA